ncbi:zinc-binding dehydrogenase [Guptibacillus algicola]|uniref:zinc-binding dehydrogenase n=1 Tax=Guptibacillus algicola TaxID=225844 RepID=UPI001CD37AFA|nr:zinc-binding dehydrogenase [Alkalihalobacillus algicola]MCA0985693.1 zinc-binding dehydrogenase [Alkalihalobacillus algicola]
MIQQSLVLMGKGKLEWERKVLDPIEKDELLIQTIAGAISIGAELPQYNESDVTDLNPEYPRETGYESFGKVIEAGEDVLDINVGDHVLAFYGHKDYGVVKAEKVVKVPETLDYTYALLNTLSCDSAKGVMKLEPNKLDHVLVTESGTMGLLTLHFLKEYMNVEKVDVLEPNKARGELAKTFGATNVYISEEEVPREHYKYGFECSSSKNAFHAILKALNHNGEVCVLSDGNKDLFFLNEDFYEKELKIVGSSDGWDYQQHSQWFFENIKKSYVTSIFDRHIDSNELIDCFAYLSETSECPIKVLVNYQGS